MNKEIATKILRDYIEANKKNHKLMMETFTEEFNEVGKLLNDQNEQEFLQKIYAGIIIMEILNTIQCSNDQKKVILGVVANRL